MSALTGLGPLELAALESLERLGATSERPHVKCSRIVQAAEEVFGFGRSYVYQVLCDLARPWQSRLPVVDFHGNFGWGLFPPAEPSFTEARLNSVGQLVCDAERRRVGPIPVGLINGTVYQGGDRPPLDPVGVLDALMRLSREAEIDDAEIQTLVGPPSFPQSCEIEGDISALYNGGRVTFTLRPRYQVADRNGLPMIIARDFPPSIWADDMVHILEAHTSDDALAEWHGEDRLPPGVNRLPISRIERLPISRVSNVSYGLVDHTNEAVEIVLEEHANPDEVVTALRSADHNPAGDYTEPLIDLRHEVVLDMGAALRDVLRAWVTAADRNTSGLEELRNQIASQRP